VTPIVTVLTTVRNGEDFIEDCVNSILDQTLRDFEYIILNNGSTDRTASILDKFTDSRLEIVHQEDLGISASLNKGVKLSRCDLIARLDADDYCLPSRLERQVELMNQHSDVVLCGARYLELTNGELSQQRVPFVETDQAIRKSMSLFNPFAHSAVIFRKKTFIKAGGYSDRHKYSQDYELWLRMLALGKALILKEELAVVRMSEQSESHKNARKQKLEGLQIRWDAFQQFGGNPGQALYYFFKTLMGLISPSKSNLNR
jgi:glycosyltransferase involved in cell wall biosynthesis